MTEDARTIDVGGIAFALRCSGEGSPTVMFESGALPFVDVFDAFRREVSATWRACSYDRAGTGQSGVSSRPRNSQTVAAELHELLAAAGERGPFVFVSWSAGAQYTLAYVVQFPDDVGGIVFVDPRTPSYQLAMPSPFASDESRELLQRLPAAYRLEVEAWDDNARYLQDAVMPDVPVVVLSAGSQEARTALSAPVDDYELWLRSHAELAGKFRRGSHTVVPDGEHRIWERNPGAVLEAIRAVAT